MFATAARSVFVVPVQGIAKCGEFRHLARGLAVGLLGGITRDTIQM
jgi:hypothetical protein